VSENSESRGGWVPNVRPYLELPSAPEPAADAAGRGEGEHPTPGVPAVPPSAAPTPARPGAPGQSSADPLAKAEPPGAAVAPVPPGWWEPAPGGAPVVLVDPPPGRRREWIIGPRGQRRPILPTWAQSWAAVGRVLRWNVANIGYAVAFHAVRTPLYAGRLLRYCPSGLASLARRGLAWWTDAEGAGIRRAAAQRHDPDDYLRLSRQRDRRVRARTLVALPALGGIGLAAALLVVAPALGRLALIVAAVVTCGMAGVPEDRPWIARAVVPPKVTRLTADVVIRALESLGIAEINRGRGKETMVAFPAPITRDGPGWRADIDLPYGVTVADIAERRERLASGLRRPLGAVWPEPATDAHAGRLVLWVGDEDMSRAPAPEWPLLRVGRTDLFAPVPYGFDPRGRPVTIVLAENNILIGSLPGAGKTAAVRVIVLAAALDPTAELWVYNLKGTGDLDCAIHVAHRYATGLDDGTILEVLASLRNLRDEIRRRADILRRVPRADNPDGKVTRALADVRALGLHPLVTVIDECQNLFSHPEHGKEAGELAVDIIKLGRALGVILVLATQRPDAASLPTGVSSNVSVRFCLRVMGQVENDMILGTSMYKNGVRATTFGPSDRGIGYLVGAADDPLITRAAYIDTIAADAVAQRARAARVKIGRLAGEAAGEIAAPKAPTFSILDDVAAVMTGDKEWSETICAALAELRPDVYGGWVPEQLSAALKPHKVATVQIHKWIDGKTVNRRGVTREAITDAIGRRTR